MMTWNVRCYLEFLHKIILVKECFQFMSVIYIFHYILLNSARHRQILPQIWFLQSLLDTNYSFRILALRPAFTGPVFHQESPGALESWVSTLFVELFTSCCWEQSSSFSPGNIFIPLGQKFRFGLVWWHELGGESPVPCVSHGRLGG